MFLPSSSFSCASYASKAKLLSPMHPIAFSNTSKMLRAAKTSIKMGKITVIP